MLFIWKWQHCSCAQLPETSQCSHPHQRNIGDTQESFLLPSATSWVCLEQWTAGGLKLLGCERSHGLGINLISYQRKNSIFCCSIPRLCFTACSGFPAGGTVYTGSHWFASSGDCLKNYPKNRNYPAGTCAGRNPNSSPLIVWAVENAVKHWCVKRPPV